MFNNQFDLHKRLSYRRGISQYLLSAALAVIGLGTISVALGQEDDSAEASASTGLIEEVVVTGYRSSLEAALDRKRNSGNVVDAIAAEDIGKSTDQNIAEALQRVTGISINRGDGEGSTVVVRGAPADLNGITLNGVPLASGGANQGVDLSQFSADVLSSIEVIKTSSADHDEGSLGATIKLNSFSPLSQKKNRRVFEYQSRRNSFAGGNDGKLSGSLSQKFMDETLGFAIVAVSESTTTRKDEYRNGNGFQTANLPAGATNIETGELITEFDYGDGNGLQPLRALNPQGIFYTTDNIEVDRDTFTLTAQFQPTDATNFKLDVTYASVDSVRDQNRINTLPNGNNRGPLNPAFAENILFDPNTFTLVRNINVAEIGAPNNRNREDAVMLTDIETKIEQDTLTFSGLVEYDVGDFSLSLTGGLSETTYKTPYHFFSRFNNNRPRQTGRETGFDCGNSPRVCNMVLSDGYTDDATNWSYQTSSIVDDDRDDDFASAYFDVDWNRSFGVISSFEAGLKWSNRRKTVQNSNTGFNNAATGGVLNGESLADFTNGETVNNFGHELGLQRDQITDGWFTVDGQAVFQALSDRFETPTKRINLRNTRDIEIDVFGAYFKANLEFMDGLLVGDVGVRWVQTENKSFGFSGFAFHDTSLAFQENIDFFGSEQAVFDALGRDTLGGTNATPTVGKNDYDNFLPSLNLNWMLTDEMILRFAASKTMARPRIDNLKPGFSITERIFDPQSNGTFGAPNLNPFEATNIDVSWEWYFEDASLFSVAFFNKDLSEFEEETSVEAYWVDNRAEFYDIDGNLLPGVDFVANAADVLLPLSGGPNQPGCMPNRERDHGNLEGPEGCDLLVAVGARNGTGGFVRGVEIAVQHNFTSLPGIWSGLGILANYTYSDSQADEEKDDAGIVTFEQTPLFETSENTFNTTIFYEDERLLLRLAYNDRSDYLLDRSTRNNHATWVEGFDSLDFSGGYQFTDNVAINVQAQNITDTVTRQYTTVGNETTGTIPKESFGFGGISSRTRLMSNTGPIYRIGLRVTF